MNAQILARLLSMLWSNGAAMKPEPKMEMLSSKWPSAVQKGIHDVLKAEGIRWKMMASRARLGDMHGSSSLFAPEIIQVNAIF